MKKVKDFVAVILTGVLILAFSGCHTGGAASPKPDNGNPADANIVKAGNKTYFVNCFTDDSFSICSIENNDDAQAEEVCRLTLDYHSGSGITLLLANNNKLYFIADDGSISNRKISLMSLDLSRSGSIPIDIPVKWKDDVDVSEYLTPHVVENPLSVFNDSYCIDDDKGSVYCNTSIPIQLNVVTGEVSVVLNKNLPEDASWYILLINGNTVCYLYEDDGLYKADFPTFENNGLVTRIKEPNFGDCIGIRGWENYFFYVSSGSGSEMLHRVNLETGDDETLLDYTDVAAFTIAGDGTVYYLVRSTGDLSSCSNDGSNEKLLIRGQRNWGSAYYLYLSDSWLYYRSAHTDSPVSRVKTDAMYFPDTGLWPSAFD
jgi:hypothetical protein